MSPKLSVVPKLEKVSPGVGNAPFRAPELSTENYDFKVDIFSSGVILYALSCYVPNKDQVIDEIRAFKQGQRGRKHLHHQDDEKLFNLINWLIEHEPSKRPTAAEALAYMQRENHHDENPTALPTKKFMVKKTWR